MSSNKKYSNKSHDQTDRHLNKGQVNNDHLDRELKLEIPELNQDEIDAGKQLVNISASPPDKTFKQDLKAKLLWEHRQHFRQNVKTGMPFKFKVMGGLAAALLAGILLFTQWPYLMFGEEAAVNQVTPEEEPSLEVAETPDKEEDIPQIKEEPEEAVGEIEEPAEEEAAEDPKLEMAPDPDPDPEPEPEPEPEAPDRSVLLAGIPDQLLFTSENILTDEMASDYYTSLLKQKLDPDDAVQIFGLDQEEAAETLKREALMDDMQAVITSLPEALPVYQVETIPKEQEDLEAAWTNFISSKDPIQDEKRAKKLAREFVTRYDTEMITRRIMHLTALEESSEYAVAFKPYLDDAFPLVMTASDKVDRMIFTENGALLEGHLTQIALLEKSGAFPIKSSEKMAEKALEKQAIDSEWYYGYKIQEDTHLIPVIYQYKPEEEILVLEAVKTE